MTRWLWGRIRSAAAWAFREEPGEAVPREAVALTCLGSLAAAYIGYRIDGATFQGYDLVMNLLGSLVLVGPGLVITNLFTVRWQRRQALAGPLRFMRYRATVLSEVIRTELLHPIKALLLELDVDLPPVEKIADFEAMDPAVRQLLYLSEEIEDVRKTAARLTDDRPDEPLQWSEVQVGGWTEIPDALEAQLARLDRELRTTEAHLELRRWRDMIRDLKLMYPSAEYVDEGDWLTFEQSLDHPEGPIEVNSLLQASVVMCTHAGWLVVAVVHAMVERQSR